METRDQRIEAYNFGEFAEEVVAQEYLKNGFTILERRWKLGKTEIDLILQKDNLLVLCEVKARKDDELEALEAVTKDKRKRMIKAADFYIRRMKGDLEYRFDIALCIGDPKKFEIKIYEDAFVSADLF